MRVLVSTQRSTATSTGIGPRRVSDAYQPRIAEQVNGLHLEAILAQETFGPLEAVLLASLRIGRPNRSKAKS